MLHVQRTPRIYIPVEASSGPLKAVGKKSARWTRNEAVAGDNTSQDLLVLTVGFLNGSPEEREFVGEIASEWSKHGNVKFHFVGPDEPYDISVRFFDTSGHGGSSLVGREAYFARRDGYLDENYTGTNPEIAKQSMKLKRPADAVDDIKEIIHRWRERRKVDDTISLDDILSNSPDIYIDRHYRRLILHEFGHALGFIHEQENPVLFTSDPEKIQKFVDDGLFTKAEPFKWNVDELAKWYYDDQARHGKGAWDKLSKAEQEAEKIKWINDKISTNFETPTKLTNLLSGGSREAGDVHDTKSIMHYAIKAHWNNVGYETERNYVLSVEDQKSVKRFYDPPQPAIRLEGEVAITGEIFKYTSSGLEKFFNIDKWESRDFTKKESITAFVGTGNSAVKVKIKMRDDSKRTFNLYLGAVRSTSVPEDISIAIGAGFLDFDVDKRAKIKDFYGFTPCERIRFELGTERSHTFTTESANHAGEVIGFFEILGESIKAISHIYYHEPQPPYVERHCELDENIDLRISPKDLTSTYEAAADYANVSLTLTASRFRPSGNDAPFLPESDTAAAPSVTVTEPDPMIPQITTLLPNYPNPFNPETWIPYHLAKPARVTLTIYAIDGKIVRHLDLGHQIAGFYQSKAHAAYWDGRNTVGERVASGIYFYTLMAGDFAATQKMLILK